MKKRILFVVTYMDTGGISRSLQNFLNLYDKSLLDVDVFAMVHQGAFKGEFVNCNVLPKDGILSASIAHFENQHGIDRLKSLFCKLLNKATEYRFQKVIMRKVGKKLLEKKYDAVIGFSEGLPTKFVSLMKHSNKISWIHCDYASYLRLNGGKSELDIYVFFRSIICVSEYTRSSFVNIYPSLENKTHAIYNIIDERMMREKAIVPIEECFDDSCFNIVTIGRIDPVKRLSIVPKLARDVVNAGCGIRWYIIGPKGTSTELELLEYNMVKYKAEEIVFLLGEKSNPYPYIANADLLVNTSVSEACPYVINEAKILGTPIVCTDFGSAKEFIDNDINGRYGSIKAIAQIIVSIIKDKSKLAGFKDNLKDFEYNNVVILQKIYSLL